MGERYEDVFSEIPEEELESQKFPDERRSKSGRLYVANEYVDTRRGHKTITDADVQKIARKAYKKLKDHPGLVNPPTATAAAAAATVVDLEKPSRHHRLTRGGIREHVERVSRIAKELAPVDVMDSQVILTEPPDLLAEDVRYETPDYQFVVSDEAEHAADNTPVKHRIPSDAVVHGQLMYSMARSLRSHLLNIDYIRMFFIKFAPQLSMAPERRPLKDLYTLVMYHTVFFGGTIESLGVAQIAPGSPDWRVLMRIKFNNNSEVYQMEREALFNPEKPISLKELRFNVDDHMRLALEYAVVQGDVSRIAGDNIQPSALMHGVLVRLLSGELLWAYQ